MENKLKIVPLELKELNNLVSQWHRHHKPIQGHRFSIGVLNEVGELIGGASIGRPTSRELSPKEILEITRLVTDGSYNACSKLYGAAARIGKEMGYKKIQTYILDTESGISLKASGYYLEGYAVGRVWKRSDGSPRRNDQPTCDKQRWVKILNK